jgi:hypothetical protein
MNRLHGRVGRMGWMWSVCAAIAAHTLHIHPIRPTRPCKRFIGARLLVSMDASRGGTACQSLTNWLRLHGIRDVDGRRPTSYSMGAVGL